ncbi:hypothetical protein LSH36_152g00018 [Paralvinella palmiformis]|uniref:Carbohydrate sulfotransferase n=1 Tax=Paralvinella palmiformis TaxID=53620 RepID=A0AAD9JW88_9ANNE|nr:hypothetical protein LSH36_152g00018 [Paralvinella palmiformis]
MVCQALTPTSDQFNLSDQRSYRSLIVDDYNKIMYCSISKVGCTTFKTMMYLRRDPSLEGSLQFRRLHTGAFLRQHGLRPLSSYHPAEVDERLRTYVKLLVVRHPLERLISAYRDKFVESNYGEKKAIRGNITGITGPVGVLNITSFLTLLTEAIKTQSTDVINYRDRHWDKQHTTCHPCFIRYDYIAKLETIDSDMEYILKFFNQTRVPHRNNSPNRRFKDSAISVGELLNALSLDVIEVLKEYYQYDFDLFSYRFNMTRNSHGLYVETGQGMC